MKTKKGTEYKTECVDSPKFRRVFAMLEGDWHQIGNINQTAPRSWDFAVYAVLFESGVPLIGNRSTWLEAAEAMVCAIEPTLEAM